MLNFNTLYFSEPVKPTYQQSPVFDALPQATKNYWIQSDVNKSASLALNILFAPAGAPILPSPSFISNDSAYFFTKTGMATLNFGHTLNATLTADQSMRKARNIAAALAALFLVFELTQLEQGTATLLAQSQTQADHLNTLVAKASSDTTAQQGVISTLNNGNHDQDQYNTLNAAYTTFLNKLSDLSVTGTYGNYTVPAANQVAYGIALGNYQNALGIYNDYMTTRQNAVDAYNTATTSYNPPSNTTNSDITAAIAAANLPSALGISLLETPAGTINRSIYDQVNGPPPASAPEGEVASITYTGTLPADLANQIYNLAPKPQVIISQQIINALITYLAFLFVQSLFPVPNTIADPLLNTKPLSKRILPDAITNATAPAQTAVAEGATTFLAAAIGLSDPHIEGLLAKANFMQLLNNFNLNLTDAQLNALTSKLQVLLVGQISANSSNALVPSLEPLANALPSLSPTSPAFGILFSTSFANRVIEAAGGAEGQPAATAEAVDVFIQGTPELQGLTPVQKNQLTAALNLGQLLLAVKLLEVNLGIDQLSAQLLLPLLPPDVAQTVFTDATQQNKDFEASLRTSIHQNFIDKGFNEAQAQFLADTGIELSKQTLTPSSSSATPGSVDNKMLQNSIAASIILADQKNTTAVSSAITQADEALTALTNENENQNTLVTTEVFRAQLENQLRLQGFKASVAIQIAQEAVIVPPPLAAVPPPGISPEIAAAPVPTPASERSPGTPPRQLNQSELINIVQQNIVQLLLPQLGIDLSNQVTQAVAVSLFGNPHPDSSDIANVKSPTSLVNTIHAQVKTLIKEKDKKDTEAIAESFSNTIQNSTDLYSFLIRAMDPAFLYVYSAGAGIMYARPTSQPGLSQSFKQSIDIIV